jgi:hypothetical protein
MMTDAWLRNIEATFERDFALQGVRAKFPPDRFRSSRH